MVSFCSCLLLFNSVVGCVLFACCFVDFCVIFLYLWGLVYLLVLTFYLLFCFFCFVVLQVFAAINVVLISWLPL